MNNIKKSISILISFIISTTVFSQSIKTQKELAELPNVVMHGVPFLVIAPDSRSGGMGELGAASEPDVWSMHWNPAKYSFAKKDFGAGLSYTPWLRNLQIKDVNQAYLAGYKRIDKFQTIGASFEYFNLGNIYFTNNEGIETGQYFAPREFALDAAYSRLLSKDFAFSIALRYIYSNLTGGASTNPGDVSHAAQTAASDISGYYQKTKDIAGIPTQLRFGFNISNLGAKISYMSTGKKDFLPSTLRLGGGTTFKLDEFNDLGINVEASKLLVPTKQYRYIDTLGNVQYQGTGDPNASVTSAMIRSFYDAPGGAKEEWHEIMWSAGLEYWYVKQFALRAGYFYENKTKGNRKFFTVGLGLRMSVIGFDAAYVLPSGGSNSPLANTWRISITVDLDKNKVQPTQQQKTNM